MIPSCSGTRVRAAPDGYWTPVFRSDCGWPRSAAELAQVVRQVLWEPMAHPALCANATCTIRPTVDAIVGDPPAGSDTN